jgi:dTDP-4-amino-4,6-dideoxygalactose transaminase
MALGVGRGDVVVTTPYTLTGGVVARLGARLAFVDINPRTYNMNPKRVFSKTLGAMHDGGLVVTADARLVERLRTRPTHGAQRKYDHSVEFPYRRDQAAVLHAKLPHLTDLIAGRQRAAAYYDATESLTPRCHPCGSGRSFERAWRSEGPELLRLSDGISQPALMGTASTFSYRGSRPRLTRVNSPS